MQKTSVSNTKKHLDIFLDGLRGMTRNIRQNSRFWDRDFAASGFSDTKQE